MKHRAAAAIPLVLVLVACGGEQATGYRPSVPAPTSTVAKPSAASQQAARLDRATFVPAMESALAQQKSWHLVYTMKTNGSTLMTMSGVQTDRPRAMSMDLSGAVIGDKTAKLTLVDDTLYLSVPGVTPVGKWVKAAGPNEKKLRSMLSDGDPRSLSAALARSTTVTFTGKVSVDGERLDRYVVTVDNAKAPEGTKQQLPADAPKSVDYEILMDSLHRIRQVHADLTVVSMTTTLSEYNKPVRIIAPPASKLVE